MSFADANQFDYYEKTAGGVVAVSVTRVPAHQTQPLETYSVARWSEFCLMYAMRTNVSLISVCFMACVPTSADDLKDEQALRAKPCGDAKLAEVMAPAVAGKTFVEVDCALQLPPNAPVITTALYFKGAAASGASVDCQGGTISAPARRAMGVTGRFDDFALYFAPTTADGDEQRGYPKDGGRWARPDGVAIRNCTLIGRNMIEKIAHRASINSSFFDDKHTERAQSNAPTNISFENVRFVAAGDVSLYIALGVTHTKVLDSSFAGNSGAGPALYLDAESAYNVFDGNTFEGHISANRETVAIDGSAHNIFVNNVFKSYYNTISLYRNCGEGGVVRLQGPASNKIIKNTFYGSEVLATDGGGNDRLVASRLNNLVYVGSRNGKTRAGTTSYCDEDKGAPYGSSVNGHDFADNNKISENYVLAPKDVYVQSGLEGVFLVGDGANNVINNNILTQSAPPSSNQEGNGGNDR